MCFSVFLLLKNARKFTKTQFPTESKLCSIKKSNAKTQNNLNWKYVKKCVSKKLSFTPFKNARKKLK